MKKCLTFLLGSFVLSSQLFAFNAASIECDRFSIQALDGNVGTKIYRGKIYYGYDVYHLTNSVSGEDGNVTETYYQISSNVVGSPKIMTIQYSLKEIEESPDSFSVTSSKSGTQTCRI